MLAPPYLTRAGFQSAAGIPLLHFGLKGRENELASSMLDTGSLKLIPQFY